MEHLRKTWKTTLIGVAMIISGLYTGIMAKTSWTESLVIIGAGIGFVLADEAKK